MLRETDEPGVLSFAEARPEGAGPASQPKGIETGARFQAKAIIRRRRGGGRAAPTRHRLRDQGARRGPGGFEGRGLASLVAVRGAEQALVGIDRQKAPDKPGVVLVALRSSSTCSTCQVPTTPGPGGAATSGDAAEAEPNEARRRAEASLPVGSLAM